MRVPPVDPRGRSPRLLLATLLLLLAGTAARAQAPGDVDCDGRVTARDSRVFVDVLFDNRPSCAAEDVNGDRAGTSADLAAVPRMLDPDPALGPRIAHLGIAGASGLPISELGRLGDTPVYFRNAGSGFKIVVEAASGDNGTRPGRRPARIDAPSLRPDLLFVCNRPLGDGNPAVCDGGVPAVPAPHIGDDLDTTLAINDIGCPFESFTAPNVACTLDTFNNPNFLAPDTRVQFCLQVPRPLEFPPGDTLCSVRVRDIDGIPGPLTSLILRVGADTNPPTFTPTAPATATPTRPAPATATRSRTPTATRTATPRPSATDTVTPTATRASTPTWTVPPQSPSGASPTPTHTAPPSATGSATRTPTRTPTGTIPFTATATRTPTGSPTATATPPPTATRTWTRTATRSRTDTPTPTSSSTRSATRTRTPTRTFTPTETATVTPTATRTRTPTRTPTATPTGPRGPVVTFFGLARPDDNLVESSGTTAEGLSIYRRQAGSGFRIVVEGAAGVSGVDAGELAFDFGRTGLPDLQMLSSRPLGNGSPAVCDRTPPNAGGVPAVDPPVFSDVPAVVDAANDVGCRFLDGNGNPFGRRGSDNSCIQFPPDSGVFRFAVFGSTIQFCGLVDSAFAFPPGDTLLTVRLRDQLGNVGEPAQIVVRIEP